MKSRKLMFGAAVAATIALVFPAQALAIATTTEITALGTATPKTTMQATDQIDAKVSASNSFDVTAQVSREVTRSTLGMTWSGESLQLINNAASRIKSPEGWNVEYTTNGTAWSATRPSSYTAITGVRATGEYTKTDSNKFQTSTTATLLANATDFLGSAGGDGFNLTFVGDRVYNVFHHESSIKLACHLKASGTTCYGAPKIFTGYSTPNSSHAWANAAGTKLFVPSMKNTNNKMGFACINLATRTNPVLCDVPFIEIAQTNNLQNAAGATQVGEKIYVANPYEWKLYCFDMAAASGAGAECANSSSGDYRYTQGGWVMEATNQHPSDPYTVYGRTNNIGGKIYWSSKTLLGCYDPATGTNCGGNAPVSIGTPTNTVPTQFYNNYPMQFPMFPVYNSSALIGACYFATEQCFTTAGAVTTTILPTVLRDWMRLHPIPNWAASDSGELGIYDKKIYFPVGPSTSATDSVYCFDYATSQACSAFGTSGTKLSVNSQIYAIQADPDSRQPNCMWSIGHAGRIKTFNATTGEPGCANASSTVRFTSDKLAPRLSCDDADHISGWGVVQFFSPGISASVLRVTVNDATGSPITDFNDVQVVVDQNSDVRGSLDLRSIPASARPTILVTATITVAGSILSDITATVGYSASDPQLCVQLLAKVKCTTAYTPPTPSSVGDGLITTIASRSATSYGLNDVQIAFVSETETTPNTITGTGAVICPASIGSGGGGGVITAPVVTSPKAKRPPVTITVGGFRDGSPILTKTIQNKIKAFLKKYNDYPVIETAGFTEGPFVLKTDFALSKARAVNANAFIGKKLKKKFSVVKIKSGQDKVEASKVRRIKITLSDE